ncbi:MAG: hypothetical protein OIN87_13885 [Candidatus Methanoperedens sp.]|nr:hypothetical protein [Candidatus Methanoperedens sp.]
MSPIDPPEEVVKATLVKESGGMELCCLKTRPYYILLLYYYCKKTLPVPFSHEPVVLRG